MWPSSSKINEAAQGMVALKGEKIINISYDSYYEDTATYNDSVEARLPPVPKILLTSHQEKNGIYLLNIT